MSTVTQPDEVTLAEIAEDVWATEDRRFIVTCFECEPDTYIFRMVDNLTSTVSDHMTETCAQAAIKRIVYGTAR